MGVYFKVLKVSPRKTMVYGQFNQAKLIASNEILIFDQKPYRIKNKSKVTPKKLSYSLFYTFSFGNFSETVNGASAESSQNSPFTIGGASVINLIRCSLFQEALIFLNLILLPPQMGK